MQPKHFTFHVFSQMQKQKYENKDPQNKSLQNLSMWN